MMGDTYFKPGLREKMGVAVNATDLSSIEDREGSVERIGALAYTQINPGAGEHDAKECEEIDPGAELGAVLLRLKAGRQYREGERALELLVHWVRGRRAYTKWKIKDGRGLLHSFARQGLAEWLWQVCPECKGTESIGLERDRRENKRVSCKSCAGSGWVTRTTERDKRYRRPCEICCGLGRRLRETVRSVKPRDCPSCRGTGRRLVNDGERARVLRVSLAQYQRHWLRRFDWLVARLDRLDHTENDLLRSALGRHILRP